MNDRKEFPVTMPAPVNFEEQYKLFEEQYKLDMVSTLNATLKDNAKSNVTFTLENGSISVTGGEEYEMVHELEKYLGKDFFDKQCKINPNKLNYGKLLTAVRDYCAPKYVAPDTEGLQKVKTLCESLQANNNLGCCNKPNGRINFKALGDTLEITTHSRGICGIGNSHIVAEKLREWNIPYSFTGRSNISVNYDKLTVSALSDAMCEARNKIQETPAFKRFKLC